MKYSILQIQSITEKAKQKEQKKFELWKKKRKQKEDKKTIRIIKRINAKIIKNAKNGLSQAFICLDNIQEEQVEAIRDYFELRMYEVKIDGYSYLKRCIIYVEWRKINDTSEG